MRSNQHIKFVSRRAIKYSKQHEINSIINSAAEISLSRWLSPSVSNQPIYGLAAHRAVTLMKIGLIFLALLKKKKSIKIPITMTAHNAIVLSLALECLRLTNEKLSMKSRISLMTHCPAELSRAREEILSLMLRWKTFGLVMKINWVNSRNYSLLFLDTALECFLWDAKVDGSDQIKRSYD